MPLWKRLTSSRALNIFSIVIGVLGLATGTIFGLVSWPTGSPRLSFVVRTDSNVLSEFRMFQIPVDFIVNSPTREKPVAMPGDKELRVTVIDVENSGPRSIDWKKDFPTPVTFAIADDAELLSVSQVELAGGTLFSSPPLSVTILEDGKSFQISTDFLDPNESLSLAVVHTGEQNTIRMSARLKDGENPVLGKRRSGEFTSGSWIVDLRLNDTTRGFAVIGFIFLVIVTRMSNVHPLSRILFQAAIVVFPVAFVMNPIIATVAHQLAKHHVHVSGDAAANVYTILSSIVAFLMWRAAFPQSVAAAKQTWDNDIRHNAGEEKGTGPITPE